MGEGHSRGEIDRLAGIVYTNKQGQEVHIREPFYWLAKPGREIGCFVYYAINKD